MRTYFILFILFISLTPLFAQERDGHPKCNLSFQEKTVWSNLGFWIQNTKQFLDKDTAWMSMSYEGDTSSHTKYCEEIPKGKIAYYHTKFDLSEDTEVRIEFLADDAGTLRLRKCGDENNILKLQVEEGMFQSSSRHLEKGCYEVKVTNRDVHGVATAFAASIIKIERRVIRNTAQPEAWSGGIIE